MNLDNTEHLEIIKQTPKENYDEHQKKKLKTANSSNDNTNTRNTTALPASSNTAYAQTDASTPNTNFIFSHTITNNTEQPYTLHPRQQHAVHTFPEFDETETERQDFKQTLNRHTACNRTIIKTQLAKTKNTFKQCVSKYNEYTNKITKTQFHKNTQTMHFKRALLIHKHYNQQITKQIKSTER